MGIFVIRRRIVAVKPNKKYLVSPNTRLGAYSNISIGVSLSAGIMSQSSLSSKLHAASSEIFVSQIVWVNFALNERTALAYLHLSSSRPWMSASLMWPSRSPRRWWPTIFCNSGGRRRNGVSVSCLRLHRSTFIM